MSAPEQVAILYCGTHGLLRDVPVEKVSDFQTNFLQIIRSSYKESVLDQIRSGKLTDEVTNAIEKVAADVAGQYK